MHIQHLNATERSCVLILRNLTAPKLCVLLFSLLGFIFLSLRLAMFYLTSDPSSLVLDPIFTSIGGFCFLMAIGILVIFDEHQLSQQPQFQYQPIV